jgi:hypothetical protein
MSKITVSPIKEFVHIIFDSSKWKNNEEYADVADEIIAFTKKYKPKSLLIQNTAYSFGDTESSPIILVHDGDFKNTFDLFIKDIIYDLIPDE